MIHDLGPFTRRSALQWLGSVTAAAIFAERGTATASAQAGGQRRLPRVSPGAAGVAPEAIIAFLDTVDRTVGGLHSFMLLRGGRVAAEGWWAPYEPQLPHMLYSLSKSFTSTAVGLCVSEGKLAVQDRVVSFFPDSLPARIDDNLAAMRVRHLLTMNTGHDQDTTGRVISANDGDWVRAFLSLPVEHEPGTRFVYNSGASYMLSAIVQKLTGMRVVDFLRPRLFDPLGIQGETWETCPKGINCGGWGLKVKTEDITRFGQLYLHKGRWGRRQLVPAAWAEEATSKQVPNGDPSAPSDWSQGYGYQFWRCRHDAFRGDGAFGQYCVVMPEMDAVLAITSGVGDMQAVLNAVWEHLLPGMQARPASGATGSGGDAALAARIAKLAVPAPAGASQSATAARVSGKTYRLDGNAPKLATARFEFAPDRCTLTLAGDVGQDRITIGHNVWIKGAEPRVAGPALGGRPAGRIAARGAWTADDTYTARVCYIETPYVENITASFDGNRITIKRKMNVGFGPTEQTPLTGRVQV